MKPIKDIFDINEHIIDETFAYLQNLSLFKEVSEFFNESADVYYLLNKCNNREMFPPTKAMWLVNTILKATNYVIELRLQFETLEVNNKRA